MYVFDLAYGGDLKLANELKICHFLALTVKYVIAATTKKKKNIV